MSLLEPPPAMGQECTPGPKPSCTIFTCQLAGCRIVEITPMPLEVLKSTEPGFYNDSGLPPSFSPLSESHDL